MEILRIKLPPQQLPILRRLQQQLRLQLHSRRLRQLLTRLHRQLPLLPPQQPPILRPLQQQLRSRLPQLLPLLTRRRQHLQRLQRQRRRQRLRRVPRQLRQQRPQACLD